MSAFAIDKCNERLRRPESHDPACFDRRLDARTWVTADTLALRTNRKQAKGSKLDRFTAYEGCRNFFQGSIQIVHVPVPVSTHCRHRKLHSKYSRGLPPPYLSLRFPEHPMTFDTFARSHLITEHIPTAPQTAKLSSRPKRFPNGSPGYRSAITRTRLSAASVWLSREAIPICGTCQHCASRRSVPRGS